MAGQLLVFEPGQSGANPKQLPVSGPHPSGLRVELGHSHVTAPLAGCLGCRWEVWEGIVALEGVALPWACVASTIRLPGWGPYLFLTSPP